MNESGTKLVRELDRWIEDLASSTTIQSQTIETIPPNNNDNNNNNNKININPILVILHDELEATPGKLAIRRGGSESASLRGHRGLISVMESLRGKGLYPPSPSSSPYPHTTPSSSSAIISPLSILRVGVGIGRPASRNRGDVSNYVLTEMTSSDLGAVKGAAGSVADLLVDELYNNSGNGNGNKHGRN